MHALIVNYGFGGDGTILLNFNGRVKGKICVPTPSSCHIRRLLIINTNTWMYMREMWGPFWPWRLTVQIFVIYNIYFKYSDLLVRNLNRSLHLYCVYTCWTECMYKPLKKVYSIKYDSLSLHIICVLFISHKTAAIWHVYSFTF